MPCSFCGDICRCSSEDGSTAAPRWHPEPDDWNVQHPATMAEREESSQPNPPAAADVASSSPAVASAHEDSSAWRQEVAVRLNRYHSRRKPRPPRYPSLRLCFEGNPNSANGASAESSTFSQVLLSNQALALDEFSAEVCSSLSNSSPQTGPSLEDSPLLPPSEQIDPKVASAVLATAITMPVAVPVAASVTAKIIEFPRSWTPPPAPHDELAEPVITRPRILEAPEIVPPPPALGGITIEPAQAPELEKRPGIDIPLQSGPVARRLLSALVDTVIIAAAGALFAFIFWKLTAIRPPRLQMVGFLVGLSGLLWAVYQYLLVVHAGTTPGLRLAGLELTRFDGSPAGRRLRRWRVLASYLSAISLGMGYGWVFLDEDALCWHDRITHTYLAVNRRQSLPTTDRTV